VLTGRLRQIGRRVPGAQRAAMQARWASLRRTEPLTSWGWRRGTPVDRWYIERYLDEHADLVYGHVLEVKEDHYASRLGARSVDVLDIDPANTRATVVGDLCAPGTLADRRYDAAVVTQTLQLVDDPAAAVRNVLEALRPGGSLLLTVPTMSRLVDVDGFDRWRWTPAGMRHLLTGVAPDGADVTVHGLGNGLVARAFLFGLALEDLDDAVLQRHDPYYPLVVGARVRVAS
jgi:SAM-dependent methyltransferase